MVKGIRGYVYMGSDVLYILDEIAMSAKEREEIQTKIQNWLVEEGYLVKLLDDPKAYYNIATQHPSGVPLNVAQQIGKKIESLLPLELIFQRI